MKRRQCFLLITLIIIGFALMGESKKKLTIFEESNLFGYKDQTGRVKIIPQYQMAFDFTEHSIAFVYSKNKWVCIDFKANEILEVVNYDNGPDHFSHHLARFKENAKIGYFDVKCRKIIKASFDFGLPFENEFAQVCNGCYSEKTQEHISIVGGKYGIINKKGKVVVPVEYDAIINVDSKKREALVRNGNDTKTLKF